MKNITVIIHTHNEEKNIKECIESARLLSQNILIIDMGSTDRTAGIVKGMDIHLETFPFHHYVEPARTFGIDKAQGEWIFILDADERMTSELAEEIKSRLTDSHIDSSPATYYKVPRKNIFGRKKWLKHGGWSPDYQIRMIHKPHFKSWSEQIHSTPVIDGSMGYLVNHIEHFFHGDLSNMVEKTTIYEDIESDLLFKAGRHVNTFTFFRKFLGELFRRLIKHRGFLDGSIGIIESIYQAYSKTITYLYLYEKKKSRTL